jgi:hypothetical protein
LPIVDAPAAAQQVHGNRRRGPHATPISAPPQQALTVGGRARRAPPQGSRAAAGRGRAAADLAALRSQAGPARLSLSNQLLVALARPKATFVAGFKSWLRLGYAVKKSEKVTRIIAPLPLKERDRASGEETGETRVLFKTAFVFDRTQVAPIEGVEQALLEPPSQPLTGDSHSHLIATLQAFAESLGYTVSFEVIDGPAASWCDQKGSSSRMRSESATRATPGRWPRFSSTQSHTSVARCRRPPPSSCACCGGWLSSAARRSRPRPRSREIARLKARQHSSRTERTIDREQVSRDLHAAGDAAAVRDDEISGHGSQLSVVASGARRVVRWERLSQCRRR